MFSKQIPVFLLSLITAASCATIEVTVGGPDTLKFNPESVTANPGDIVQFNFQQKNHTATQSTFEAPCIPAPNGFDSDFVPVFDPNGGSPVALMTIADTNPIWVYCRQGNHCQQGMVFAVNPGDRFEAFKAAATGGAPPTATAATTAAPYGSSAAPPTSTSTDHRVIVGGPGKLAFEPTNVAAQAGDTVTFEFRQKNHTVTASTFDAPCRALSLTSTTGQVGFDSGFMAVADGVTTFPTYTIQINDTKPVWAYCRQGNHCGQGMVFSVNSVENGPENFAAFQARAQQLNGTGQTGTAAGNHASLTFASQGAGTLLALTGLIVAFL